MRHYRTLLLNSDFNPLSTWPLSIMEPREAISAIYRDRVTVVENWQDAFFRSPSVSIPVPKVVALKEYAHVQSSPKFCRRSILLRDKYTCQYCGKVFPSEELTFDHVIPRSAGGRTEWQNILTCCTSCNSKKKNTLPNYSGRDGCQGRDGSMRPLKVPRKPTSMELLKSGLQYLPTDLKEDFSDWLYWNVELET